MQVRKSGENGMIINPVPLMERLMIENKLPTQMSIIYQSIFNFPIKCQDCYN